MIKLYSVRSADGGDGVRLSFDIDGVKKSFIVSADDFLSLGVTKGELDECVFDEICDADAAYGAVRAAIRILSAGQCSKKKLYEKLRRRGFTHECAKNASDFASKHGYIDEEWQIESYIRELVEKKFVGRRKVVPMLIAKGYSGDKISAVLDEKYTEEDFKAAKRQFLMKKFGKTKPETYEEAEEMKKALYKQGY
ncbi:MAG: RecX family transcriptional regulator [Clostridia bacterium]|nr:RecX family transcriptional regulator [Clostridia bacterium]